MKKHLRELSRALPGWELQRVNGHFRFRHPSGARLTTSSTPRNPDTAIRRARVDADRALHSREGRV